MPEADRPLLADVKREAVRLGADLREMASLRWELARLELEAVTASVKRLAIAVVAAVVLALTALPVLVVGGAEALVTTQKDLVKLRRSEIGQLPLWALRIRMRILAGADLLDDRLARIDSRASPKTL